MKSSPVLHHYCQNITTGNLATVVEMYRLLGFDVTYDPGEKAGWLMVGQKHLKFDIQITEVSDTPITDIEIKKRTHIAFLSDDPQSVLDEVRVWAMSKNIKFREGGWSEVERFFDLSDIFTNFVVEVMHSSVES